MKFFALLTALMLVTIGGADAKEQPRKRVKPQELAEKRAKPTANVASAVRSDLTQNARLKTYSDWVKQEIDLGHPVSDRLMQFYNKVTGSAQNQKSAQELKKANFEKLESNLQGVRANLSAKLKDTKKECKKKCCKKIPISQKDFGPLGLIINKPGLYCFAENIEFCPGMEGVPAISIQSDYVTIDMDGKYLTECLGSFSTFNLTSGIVIESGFNFVTIKNGTITGFSNLGVFAKSINQAPTDHLGIIVEHMKVNNCGKPATIVPDRVFNSRSGIGIDGATEVLIDDCMVSNISSMIETDVISAYFSDDVIIKDCIATSGSTELTVGGDGNGIIVGFFNNAVINNCTGSEISSFFPIGIIGFSGDNLTIDNCQGHNNNGALIACGLAVQIVNNAVVTNCAGNENSVAEVDPTQSFADAIGIFNGPGNFNVVIRNCTANKNVLTANAITPVPVDSGADGILTYFTNNSLIEDCVAMQNQVASGVSAFRVTGFTIETTSSNVVIRNCVASDHSSTLGSVLVAGFLVGTPPAAASPSLNMGITIDSCTAVSNVNSGDPTNGFGIYVADAVLSSSIVNNEVQLNDTGIGVAGQNTTGNLIQNNTVMGNTLFGIQDTTCTSNAYINNFSYNEPAATGVCSASFCGLTPLTGDQNYCGLPNGTPVRTWTIGNPPAASNSNGVSGDKLDNLDVSN